MIKTLDRAQKAAQQRNWATLTACLRQLVPPEPSLDLAPRSLGQPPHAPVPTLNIALDLAMEALIEGDFQSRWDLAKVIPKFGAAAIVPLLDLINDVDLEWETRWFAARILGEIRHPAVLAHLVTLLQTNPDPELQAVAAAALVNYGEAAIATLIAALQQPETELMAVQALAQMGTPAVLPGLLIASQSAQATCREVAIAALGHLHDVEVAPHLLQAVQDPIAAVRQAAMQGLSHRPEWLDAVDSFAALTDRLWDVDLAVCETAALALGRLGAQTAAPATAPVVATLVRVLRSPQTPLSLQLSVVQALGWIETPVALTELALAAPQLPDKVQVAIATVLGQVSPAQQGLASAQLSQLLTDPVVANTPQLRQAIAHSLGHLGQVSATASLVTLLNDPVTAVKLHAIAALKQLAPDHPALPTR